MSVQAHRYYVRALEKLQQGQAEDACQDFQAAIRLVDGFFEARIGLATALLRLHDAPRAVQTLRVGLHYAARPRERVPLLRALGDALIAGGDFPGAEEALAEATQLGGADAADLHDRLARVRARTGRYQEAFDELLRAARLGA